MIYNYNLVEKSNSSPNIFDLSIKEIDESNFNYIFLNIVKKQNRHLLNVNDFSLIKKFYNFPYINEKYKNVKNGLVVKTKN